MAALNNIVRKKVALVMGVANTRSIAWACVESFLQKDYDCIITFRNDGNKFAGKIHRIVHNLQHHQSHDEVLVEEKQMLDQGRITDVFDNAELPHFTKPGNGRILGCIPCNVDNDIPSLFQEMIPELLMNHALTDYRDDDNTTERKLDAIVHSIAFADMKGRANDENTQNENSYTSSKNNRLFLSDATWESYQTAQRISSYSLLETAHYALETDVLASLSSITALTYIGAVRAVPNYHVMGPAKASLEAIVRGLALDLGSVSCGHDTNDLTMEHYTKSVRVNAVSAGPLKTAAARGIPGFTSLYHHTAKYSPLQRYVTTQEVAEAVTWIASPLASGITGQTIYVDGGYSAVVPCDMEAR